VPTDIGYQQLYERIRERLKIPDGEDIVLSYCDGEGVERVVGKDEDWDIGREGNQKVILVVKYA